jgi:hypothetical protein
METSELRKRVNQTVERARRQAAERRAQSDEAGRAFETFLSATAVPLFRQIANVLRSDGYQFSVFTPSGSVRLMSERTAEDFIELTLDTTGDVPEVIGRTSRSRGRRVSENERAVGSPAALSENDLLDYLAKELEALVER